MKTQTTKPLPAAYALYEIPELEETEFFLSVSPCPQIEDANENGRTSDSLAFGMDTGNEYFDD